LEPVVQKVEEVLADRPEPLKVAIMGCEVNGPGEAREADLGVAVGKGTALLFRKGEVVQKVKTGAEMVTALLKEVEAFRKNE
jgi:(E)-4-hydroxy-3-methylbut-2-enyl-diphosphate synthase